MKTQKKMDPALFSRPSLSPCAVETGEPRFTMHFSLDKWTDYVRGVTGRNARSSMESHLRDGCVECAARKAAVEAVALAAPLLKVEVPRDVLERAIGIYQPPSRAALRSLPELVASLVFDSALQPSLAGVRSGTGAYRETMYQAGPYNLSLRLEKEPSTALLALVGQILPPPLRGDVVAQRPVFVFQGEKLVARTLSGRNGEFQMEFAGKWPLRLVVTLDHPDRRLEVDLARLDSPRPDDEDPDPFEM